MRKIMAIKNKRFIVMQKNINRALFFLLFILLQQCAPPNKRQETTWPGERWATSTPEAEGLNAAAIDSIHTDIASGSV
jgi:hypothetical protein